MGDFNFEITEGMTATGRKICEGSYRFQKTVGTVECLKYTMEDSKYQYQVPVPTAFSCVRPGGRETTGARKDGVFVSKESPEDVFKDEFNGFVPF